MPRSVAVRSKYAYPVLTTSASAAWSLKSDFLILNTKCNQIFNAANNTNVHEHWLVKYGPGWWIDNQLDHYLIKQLDHYQIKQLRGTCLKFSMLQISLCS